MCTVAGGAHQRKCHCVCASGDGSDDDGALSARRAAALARLKVLERTQNGLRVAEADLKLRCEPA